MPRSRILSSLAAASFGVLLLGACSAEGLTERAASFGLEQAIEGNEDIDIDFSGDGGINFSSEEGSFSLNFDEENGGINFSGPDGDGAIRFDENGIRFSGPDGDGTISFDQDNGTIDFDGPDGDGSVRVDNDNLVLETEDGSFNLFGGSEAPDSWPAGLAQPASLVPGSANYTVLDLGTQGVVTTGVFEHDPAEPYAASVTSTLVASGWQVTVSQDANGSYFAQLGDGNGGIAQVIADDTGTTTVTFTQTA